MAKETTRNEGSSDEKSSVIMSNFDVAAYLAFYVWMFLGLLFHVINVNQGWFNFLDFVLPLALLFFVSMRINVIVKKGGVARKTIDITSAFLGGFLFSGLLISLIHHS